MAKITTFIRWAGGKSWLAPFVKDLTKDLNYNNYFEPFMGGASIFFALETKNKCFLSDVNYDLINAFISVRDNVESVISYLQDYRTDADSYYRIRAHEPIDSLEKAARFYYLNATSFNGLYRVNKQGKYNVPYGKKSVTINYARLAEASRKLANTSLQCHDFSCIKEMLSPRDFVFLDPPYAVTKGENGFLAYNPKLFSLEDQYRLAELIDYINSIGAYYVLTNAAHANIEAIFANRGRMLALERNSLIGGRKAYRGKIQEYIFTNISERGVNSGTY